MGGQNKLLKDSQVEKKSHGKLKVAYHLIHCLQRYSCTSRMELCCVCWAKPGDRLCVGLVCCILWLDSQSNQMRECEVKATDHAPNFPNVSKRDKAISDWDKFFRSENEVQAASMSKKQKSKNLRIL